MFFDTHAHLDDVRFDSDREELISSLPATGISHALVPGSSLESSRNAMKIACEHPNIYFAAGVHPGEIGTMTDKTIDDLADLAEQEKCVAIGEIGLDFYWYRDLIERDTQRYWFYQQLYLARELNLPVIVHDREAHKECFDAVNKSGVRGVFHCYSSSAEMAMELVKIGFYCSFTGVVTYQGARKSILAIEKMPMERILIETDSPYLAPVPHQKDRNDPRNVRSVAEVIARVKNLSVEEVARITSENAARLFKISLLQK